VEIQSDFDMSPQRKSSLPPEDEIEQFRGILPRKVARQVFGMYAAFSISWALYSLMRVIAFGHL
jgi:hypothetical protein